MSVARSARPPADSVQEAREGEPRGQGDAARDSPVIVLASAYSGADRLAGLLGCHPALACTTGTGVLPLCEQAMAVWRNADGRAASGRPSRLASTTTRTLVTSAITSILVREGKRRWCEVAAASPRAAEAFLRLYPGTRFVCLYRAFPGAIRAALDASPWGLADPEFAPFTRAYPASTVAALTAYWVAHTGSLLEFEHSHPQACLRIRSEDLADDQHQVIERILSFSGLPGLGDMVAPDPDSQAHRVSACPEADLPANLIPPAMLTQANDMLRELGYPALPAAATR